MLKGIVKGFAMVALPLHKLTQKDGPFGGQPSMRPHSYSCARHWKKSQCLRALTKQFIVSTHASNVGISAILLQDMEAGE